MKKGFTLVELLAVIVILAVILIIAIPQVLKVVDNSRISAYIKNEQMVLKAVDVYVSRNTEALPGKIGDTTEVSISYLVSNGMLTGITNPYNKNEDCTGYITITKLSDTEYDYTPHLKCGLDIHDSSDDGLVLHYKFDDFQEPTENLVPVNRQKFVGWSGHHGSIFSIEQNVEVQEWQTKNATRIQTTGGTNAVKFHYPVVSAPQSGTYSISVYVKNIGLNPLMISGNRAGTMGTLQPGEMGHFSATGSGFDGNTSNIQFLFTTLSGRTGDSLDFVAFRPQTEQKPYSTPFVEVIREGIVKDYSGNNNHAHLDLETTPRWLEKGKVGKGAYEFDGENTSIIVGNHDSLNLTQEKGFTFHAWVNPSEGYGNVYPRIIDKSHFLNIVAASGRPYFRVSSDDNNSMAMAQDPLTIDEWTHLVGTYNPSDNRSRLYVNGVLAATSGPLTEGLKNTSDISLKIGDNGGGTRLFNGLIDDVRIYNRALTEQEIKLLYESTK